MEHDTTTELRFNAILLDDALAEDLPSHARAVTIRRDRGDGA